MEIRLTIAHKDVEKVIGQDPMADLEKPVDVFIGGVRFTTKVGSYVSDGRTAKLVLFEDPDSVREDE